MNEKHKEFLERLRDSGSINMFGAGYYLERRFKITEKEACKILTEWMGTFKK